MDARLPNRTTAERDQDFALHPYTNLKAHETQGPLVIARGQGISVIDDTGKEYIEGLAGLWCAALGFSEERVVEAATRQLRTLPFYHQFGHKAHAPGVELAERLIGLAPVPMSKAFFCNSGSEANDTAIKIIWYVNNAKGRPQKKKLIARTKAYHGVTVASASLTGLPHVHRDFDLPIARVLHTDCPHHYRFAHPGESEEAFSERLANNLEEMILREGPDTVAAFFAEPLMGAGGVIVPPAGYFEKIQAVLKRYDVMLVADEVICGFGRTGNLWGTETFGLKPDIMTMAKALSSAYLPISAVLVNEDIYRDLVSESEKIGTFGHGYTYTGHPVCAAVANEVLEIYRERDILGHVRQVSPRFQEGLRRFADHPLVGEVRGVGLIAGVELVADKATKEPFNPKLGIGNRVNGLAHKHGLILRAMGDTLGVCPPLIISEAEIDELLRRFGAALDEAVTLLPAWSA